MLAVGRLRLAEIVRRARAMPPPLVLVEIVFFTDRSISRRFLPHPQEPGHSGVLRFKYLDAVRRAFAKCVRDVDVQRGLQFAGHDVPFQLPADSMSSRVDCNNSMRSRAPDTGTAMALLAPDAAWKSIMK